MLPVQKLLVPLFWNEVGDWRAKKDMFSFAHTVVESEDESTVQHWNIRVHDAAALQHAVEAALSDRISVQSRPFPSLYPPPRPVGSKSAMAMPVAPTTEAEAKERDENVSKIQRERAERLRKVIGRLSFLSSVPNFCCFAQNRAERDGASSDSPANARRSRGQLVVGGKRVSRGAGAATSVSDVMEPQADVEIIVATEKVEDRRERRKKKEKEKAKEAPVEGSVPKCFLFFVLQRVFGFRF